MDSYTHYITGTPVYGTARTRYTVIVMVRYGMVRYGKVRYGKVRYGKVR